MSCIYSCREYTWVVCTHVENAHVSYVRKYQEQIILLILQWSCDRQISCREVFTWYQLFKIYWYDNLSFANGCTLFHFIALMCYLISNNSVFFCIKGCVLMLVQTDIILPNKRWYNLTSLIFLREKYDINLS